MKDLNVINKLLSSNNEMNKKNNDSDNCIVVEDEIDQNNGEGVLEERREKDQVDDYILNENNTNDDNNYNYHEDNEGDYEEDYDNDEEYYDDEYKFENVQRKEIFLNIDKIGFYELVLKQLLDDNLIESYNMMRAELNNLEENKNVKGDFLFNMYLKSDKLNFFQFLKREKYYKKDKNVDDEEIKREDKEKVKKEDELKVKKEEEEKDEQEDDEKKYNNDERKYNNDEKKYNNDEKKYNNDENNDNNIDNINNNENNNNNDNNNNYNNYNNNDNNSDEEQYHIDNVSNDDPNILNKLIDNNLLKKKLKMYNNNNFILNYDVNSERVRRTFSYEVNDQIELIHKNKCLCCDINYNNTILCSGGSDNIVKISKMYDIKNKKKIYNIDKHKGKVNCINFHPFKNILFSGSDDCTIQIIDVNKIFKMKKQNYYIRKEFEESYQNISIQDKNPYISLYVHPCGDFLYASNKNENILKMYDLETLTCFTSIDTYKYHTSQINDIHGTIDGTMYSSVSDDGHIKIWDGHNSKLVHTQFNAHNGYSIESVKFNKSGFYMLTAGLDGQSKIWDLRNFKSLFTFGNGLSCSSNKSIFMNNEYFIANIIQPNEYFKSQLYIYNAYFGNMEYNIQNIHNDKISDITNATDLLSVYTTGYDCLCKHIQIEQKYLSTLN
ncbi:cleavage stimulation factor subunit 1, putative [Plasmodium gaboni]|uniref:Cleavage stimulation factor 50 kDa subunit n=1 Tax=Plasmodium gaboni TaxID=647221 RepID=A0ABY1UK59_9APIC|nr:cleavage stimulation factor subunit 1, putative [Plasmodium gaboni]